MDNTAKNPEEAVVSVWTGKLNVGRFIGTAFFISPSLLLTAKHVVLNTKTDALFSDIYLGLVVGRQEVKVSPKNIHYCDDYDVAMIKLDEPDKKQAFCGLSVQDKDYRDEAIDCYAINKANNSRDSLIRYTVGILDQDHNAYRFDHSAAKGFSGGAVTLYKQHYVIGILSSRVQNEQETLFIPLYKCKAWLDAINQELNDSHLEAYLNPAASSQFDVPVSPSSSQKLPHYLNELALFIGRPHTAYTHVLDHLFCGAPITNNNRVKACLCLFTSEEDQPRQFAEALGIRLETGVKNLLDHKLLGSKDAYDVKPLSHASPWDCSNQEDFFLACLKSIAEALFINDPFEQTDSNAYFKAINEKISGRNNPIVFISENASKPVRQSWWPPAKTKTLADLQKRQEWVKAFGQQLWYFAKTAVVFIFCLQVPEPVGAENSACFSLIPITDNEFFEWAIALDLLLHGHLVCKREVSTQIMEFRAKFNKIPQGKKSLYPMSYQHFIEQTKTITKQMANK